MRQSDKAAVFDALLDEPWTAARPENDRRLTNLLLGGSQLRRATTAGPARRNFDLIERSVPLRHASEIAAAIEDSARTDPWLVQAAATLAAGSPSSAALVVRVAASAPATCRSPTCSASSSSRRMHCAARPDFAEGIRALLIDKDRRPQWSPATLAEAEGAWVEGYFVSPWQPAEHPLADL